MDGADLIQSRQELHSAPSVSVRAPVRWWANPASLFSSDDRWLKPSALANGVVSLGSSEPRGCGLMNLVAAPLRFGQQPRHFAERKGVENQNRLAAVKFYSRNR
jgi:hypothetical protein